MTKPRIALALLVAPCSAPIAVVTFFVVISRSGSFDSGLSLAAWISGIVSYIGVFIFGLPSFYFLRKFEVLNFFNLVWCGVLTGILLFSLFMWGLASLLGSDTSFAVQNLIWGAALGGIVAISFGVIAGVTSKSSDIRRSAGRVN